MKYVLAGLAVVAAAAALFFRPPQSVAPVPATGGRAPADAREAGAAGQRWRSPATTGERVVVYVAGEVRKPGVYTLRGTERAVDALGRAGGPLADADLVAVNLAAPLHDGDELAVPRIGAVAPSNRERRPRTGEKSARTRKKSAPRSRRHTASTPATPVASIDLNAADADELEAVPGVGPALAARIVAYRDANGPFASIDELADVSGITPRLQDTLAEYFTVR